MARENSQHKNLLLLKLSSQISKFRPLPFKSSQTGLNNNNNYKNNKKIKMNKKLKKKKRGSYELPSLPVVLSVGIHPR